MRRTGEYHDQPFDQANIDQANILAPVIQQIKQYHPRARFHWHVAAHHVDYAKPAKFIGSFETKEKAEEKEIAAREPGYKSRITNMHRHGPFGIFTSRTHVGYLNEKPHTHDKNGAHYE